MIPRSLVLALVCAVPLSAQVSQDGKFEILRTVIAQQAAARVAMPTGSDGIEVSETGELDPAKISKQVQKDGLAIEPGKVVTVTSIDFGTKSIEVELDGGGKKKKGFFDHIQVGVGNTTAPVGAGKDDSKAK